MGVIRQRHFGSSINGIYPAFFKLFACLSLILLGFTFSSFFLEHHEPLVDCDNVTSGGALNGDQSEDGYYDPGVISNVSLPSGGSGTIEYLWLKAYGDNQPPVGSSSWISLPNVSGPTYDPGTIGVTTHFMRCARRNACSSYDGESNIISKLVVNTPSQCNLENFGTPVDGGNLERLVWMKNTANDETIRYAVDGSASFTEFEDLTATLTGSIVDVLDANCKWDFTVNLKAKRDWGEWSGLGRTYEFNSNCDLHESWYYYEVDNNNSYMTGQGCNAGQTLTITHSPSDLSKGFQIGEGANLKNCEFGMSGWFAIDGTDWDGHGDFNGILTGCSSNIVVCDNVESGGTIGSGEIICGIPGDPAEIESIQPASGGSGSIEYQWLSFTEECPDDLNYAIPGATGLSYDPGPITQPTWYVRCARRENCTEWVESNCIYKDVAPDVDGSAQVSSNYNGADISCTDASDGSATASGALGTPPYEYAWSNNQTTATINGLTAGTYTVTITDDKNCTVTRSVTLADPFIVGVSVNITSDYNGAAISCDGAIDGAVSAAATGGTGNYSYTWSTGQTGANQSGLGEGSYTVIASDVNGCTAEATVVLEDPETVQAEASVVSDYNGQDISCSGANNGVALVNTTGGVTPYSYNWSNGANSQQVSDLAPGNYTVTITDANNCSTTAALSLTEPTTVNVDVVVSSNYNGQQISCFGASDGAATASGNGGVSPYTYQWDAAANFQTSATASNLSAGTYSVTVYDANGCGQPGSVTVEEPTQLDATAVVFSDYNGAQISCTGEDDGLAAVTASEGTAPYTYEWSNGETTQNASNLTAGTYTVTVMDANNCTVIRSVTLTDPLPVSLATQITTDFNGTVISCFGENDGSASATAAGGTGAYTYNWSNGQTGPNAVNLVAGTYTVIVADVNGCTADEIIVLEQPESVQATAEVISNYNGMDISCNGASDGIALVTTTGGVTPYSYDWSNGQTTQQIENLAAGTYDVIITDANGCSTTTSISLSEPTAVTSTAAVASVYNEGVDISILGGNDGSAIAFPGGGTAPYTFQWDDPAFQTTQTASNLSAGTYTVLVSDANGCTSSSQVTLLDPAKIGDKIFEDLNGNGMQDPGEPGVPGVVITLTGTADDGTEITRTVSTDANGNYNFDGLPPGSYKITINVPGGYEITYQDEVGNETNDSDINPLNGMSDFVSVTNGDFYQDLDGGLYQPASIGDFVWNDLNGNGIQDNGEPGIQFVEVTLTGTTGNGTSVTFSLSTDVNGEYLFQNLKPGSYKLTFSAPAGYEGTYVNQGTEETDNNADPANGNMTTFEILESGETNLTYDAGFYAPASIGNFVWDDTNGNGIQDGGEPGIPNVEVTLTGTTGDGTSVVLTEFTGANGQYLFDNLRPGSYKLTFSTPTGFKPIYQNQGTDIELDSDPNVNDGMTVFEVLESGENNLTYDAGFYAPASIGNFVWEDLNGNGVQDNGEPGIENVQVLLSGFTGNGTPVNLVAFTGPNGEFLFDDLVPGTYKLTFITPTGYEITYMDLGGVESGDSDIDPANGMTTTEVLVSGENNLDFDGGFYLPASIGDFVWEDLNGNGTQDTGEPGLGGVQVTLTGTDGSGFDVTLILSTNPDGSYEFPNLRPGSYKLTFGTLPGYIFTYADQNGDDTTDSDADTNNGMTTNEILTSGENNEDYDAGLFTPATIGNYAWKDCNKNGIQDAGEEPLGFVPVALTGSTGAGVAVNLSTSTLADGTYIFVNLFPGTYVVTFGFPNTPTGLDYSPKDQGGNDALDSDVNGSGASDPLTVVSGENNESLDAGFMDVTPPTISPAASNLTVQCDGAGNTAQLNDWLATNAGAAATDNCSPVTGLTWTNDFVALSDECGATGTATVTFTVTDECGNSNQTTATFTIEDTTAPSINVQASNYLAECDGGGNGMELSEWLENNGGATATDICGGVAWSNNFANLSDLCGATGATTIIFTATDDCGNTSTSEATFTISDTTAPTIVSPAVNQIVECDGVGNLVNLNAFLDNNAGALATDVCGGVVFSNDYNNNLSDLCGGTGAVTVTFTATDDCGNTSTTAATFTIEDTTPPSIGIEASNLEIECDGGGNNPDLFGWLDINGGAGATDICGSVNWSNNFAGLSDECGATGSATVTFTATDECGNTSTTSAAITIVDNTPPVIQGQAVNQTVQCDGAGNAINLNAWLDSNAGALATDVCGDVSWSNNFTALSDDCGATGSATVTFTATDDCGNTSTTVATFTIEDTTAPNIGIPASNLLVECDGGGNGLELQDWLNTQAGAGATDICSGVEWSNDFPGSLSDDCGATGSVTVTFTATDACNNTSTTSATFTIEDTTAPTIVTPATSITVECDGVGNQVNLNAFLDNFGGALATDVCGGNITWASDFTALSDDCGDTGTATVTFTATDECGNTSTTVATFTIEDTMAPSIGIEAADLTVQCDGGGNGNELIDWLDAQGGAGATDICGGVNWSNDFSALSDECGATGSTTVTFTAADECGNTSTTSATFTIEDTTAPTIVQAAADQTVQCDGVGNLVNLNAWLDNSANALATDVCSQLVSWTNDYNNNLSDLCGQTGSVTVNFIATDDCGNTSTTSATFTIEDTVAPSIGIPASNLTVQCDGGGNGNELFDWIDNQGGAGATDICGGVQWSNDFPGNLSDDCGATGSTTVTFTATDDCGNTSTTSATFTIIDTTDPTIVQEAINQTVECDGQNNQVNFDAWMTNNAGALATDVCGGNITWTNNYNNQPIPECDSIQITFTAMDECGNESPTAAWFIVEDTEAPQLLGVPDALNLECDEAIPAAANVVANDVCDPNVTLVANETSTQGGSPISCDYYNYEIVRTWTATDECGNVTEDSQLITVSDNTAPEMTSPAQNAEAECDGGGNQSALNAWLTSNGGASATDNCSTVSWTNDYNNLIPDCGNTGAVTVTFTAVDACGNTTQTTATFTVVDTTDPNLLGVPANADIECDQAVPTAANVSATDICDSDVEVNLDETSTQGTDAEDCAYYNYERTRIWTATDDCGNTATAAQIITVSDDTAPAISTQAQNAEVACNGSGNAADLTAWLDGNGGAAAVDNCSDVGWTNNYGGNLNPDCGATGAIEVTFTASDACGNTSVTTATFTIIDSASPDLLNVPANASIACDEAVPAIATLLATDICDTDVEVIAAETSTQDTDPANCNYYNYELIRTWTATDDCGNTATASQTITVADDTAPEMTTQAQNGEAACDGSGNAAELNAWLNGNGGAAATDNCSAVVWSNDYSGNLTPDCGASGAATVTFTASDACGNTAVSTATFTILDTTDPDLLNVPANAAIDCDEAFPNPANVTATDICDTNVEVVLSESSTQGSDLSDCAYFDYELIRTWTATDDCGNTATASQTITVADDEAPAFSTVAQDTELECSGNSSSILNTWINNNGGATATDNCSAVVWTNDYSGNFNVDCGSTGTVTVTFTASDVCGNENQSTATFTIVDTTDPDLLNVPVDATASCDEALPSPANVTATDICDTNVEINLDENNGQGADPASCDYYNYDVIRTWTATDDCGNTSTASQTISVSDATAPQMTQFAQNAEAECDGSGNQAELNAWLSNNGGAAATDNCSEVNWSNNYNGNLSPDCGVSGSIEVTFTASDVCGNENQTIATFTIIDSTDPDLLGVPANASIDCNEAVPAAANVTGNDACDTNVEVVLNTSDTQGNDVNDCSYYTYEILNSWTAIDDCGNTATATQTISVSDTGSPEISVQAEDTSVECDGSGNNAALQSWLNNNGTANATDDCSEVYWSNDFSGNLPTDCGASGSVEVTFTAQDACGNSVSTTATFTIEDTEGPDLLGIPADASVSCDAVPTALVVNATDLCDTNVEVVLDEVSTQSSNPADCAYYTYELTRTWTAIDDCGNTSTASQTISVADNATPEITNEAEDLIVECDGSGNAAALSSWLNDNGTAAATDNCSSVNWSNDYNGNLNTDCGEAGSITVTFTATDACGNETTTQATFAIEDTEGPDLLNVPADETVNCGEVPSVATITANDVCDMDVEVVESETSTQGSDATDCNFYSYEIVRTWTAIDDCGNTSTASQTITVADDESPEITTEAVSVEVECDGSGNFGDLTAWVNNHGGAAATDNCSGIEWSNDFSGNYIPDCGDAGEVAVTFIATDACGNTSTSVAQFTILDTTAPDILNAPDDITVECDNVPDPAPLTATDLCDDSVFPLYYENVTPSPGCAGDAYQIARTWIATDDCGNSSEVTQIVTVEDSTPPELLGVPADVTANCDEIPSIPAINDDIIATDNCDAFVQITFNEQMIPGGCGSSFTLVRTWTAIDNCGNQDIQSQNISVGDDSPPLFSDVPDDMNMECPAQGDFDMPTVTDDCSDVNVIFDDETIAGACPQSYSMVRTWTATDDCGNVTTVSRTMTVEDTTAPTLIGIPSDVTVDLGNGEQVPEPANVSATDLCDTDVDVSLEETEVLADCGYVMTRTWTAIDDCGNEAQGIQNITVIESLSVSIDADVEICEGSSTELTLNLNDPLNTYNWSSTGGQLTNTSSSTPSFEADAEGTYTITVSVVTSTGCEGEDTFIITVTQAPQGTADANGPLCVGATIELLAGGGSTYEWSGPGGFSSTDQNPDIDNADLGNSGTYTVVVSTGDCSSTQTVVVDVNSQPVAQITGATDLCDTDNLQLIASGGSTYEWSGPAGFTSSSSTVNLSGVTDDNAGTYTVTVTDFNGCEGITSVDVTIGGLTVSAEADNNGPLCIGQTLELYATPDGADYVWTGPNGFTSTDQNPVIFNVSELYDGEFTVEVTDGSCTSTATTIVDVKTEIDGFINSNSPVCEGDDIQLSAGGGTLVSWTGPDGFTSNDDDPTVYGAEELNAGIYTAIIGTGICKDTLTVEVMVAPGISADFNVVDADCDELGSINIGATGGTGNYSFDWEDIPGNNNDEDRDDLVAGSYNVTIYDDGGCEFELNGITIINTCDCDADAGDIIADADPVCLEGSPSFIAATPAGNQVVPPGYTTIYVLTEGSDLTIIGVNNNPVFDVFGTGDYIIHTLIYDPATLDLSIVIPGTTTAGDVLALLQQGGGDICASLDVDGAPIMVIQPIATVAASAPETCDGCNGQVSLTPSIYNYSWSDGGSGADRDDLCSGDYTVTVTNADGCESQLTLTVDETCGCVEPVVTNIVVIEANCGVANGSATLQLSANPANYAYAWSPNAGTSVGAGNGRIELLAGQYTVTISDPLEADCETIVEFAVGNLDGPEVEDVIVNDATCTAADGAVTILPGTFTYIWVFDNLQSNSRSDLAAGFYEVIVFDPSTPDCPDVITIEVGQENNLVLQEVISVEPECGEANGTVTITVVSGGSGSQSYEWSDDPTLNVPVRTDLASGTYAVIVTDLVSGCSNAVVFVLNDNVAGANVNVGTEYETSCVGSNDGQATILVSYEPGFENPPTQYMTDGSGQIYNNGMLAPGQYCVVIEDGNGCIAGSGCFEIVEPPVLDVDVALVNADCQTDGSITLMVSGGTGTYTFDWDDLAGSNDPQNRTDLTAGLYSVTVTDGNGCSAMVMDLVVSDECTDCEEPILNNVVVVEATCNNSDGMATLYVAGNAADFSYDWNTTLGQSNTLGNSRTDLPAGTYTVTISDENDASCFIVEAFTIGNSDGPEAMVITTAASCSANDGTAILAPGTYEYDWSDGQSGAMRADLLAGTYQVTITDPSNGNCNNVITVVIDENNNLDASVSINTLPECTEANGSATVVVNGGSGNYAYSWGNDATLDNLAAGTYTVSITDLDSGCTAAVTFTLNNDVPGATVTIVGDPTVSCAGAMDGSVNFGLDFDPGFDFPETVIITDGSGATYTAGQLGAGDYCIVVLDAAGCTAGSACFEVTEPSQIDVDVALVNKDCTTDGSITLQVSGGNGGYTFDWSDLIGNDDPQDRSGLSSGTYDVTVTDVNGCTAVAAGLTIEDECGCEGPVVNNVVVVESACFTSSGMATINMAGNAADFDYNWTPSVSTSNVANNMAAGTYSVTIVDPNDPACETIEVFTVGNADGPEAALDLSNPATCLDANGQAVYQPSSFTYTWSDGVVDNSRADLLAGIYQITVSDGSGCTDVLTLVVDQVNDLEATANVNANPDCGAADGSVTIDVTNGSGDYSYSWGAGATQADLAAGTYDITVVDNDSGCSTNVVFTLTEDVAGATIDITNPDDEVMLNCAGDSNGLVDFDVDFDPNFEQPAVVTIVNNLNEVVFNNNLSAGTYCIQVTDVNGCLAAATCFDVLDPDQIDVDVALTPFTCLEAGSIDLTVTGGNGSYTYDWVDLIGNDDPEDRTDLQPGVYSVTITDAGGCTAVANNLVILDDCNPQTGCEEPEVLNIVKIEASCGASNGTATIMMNGNEADFTYEWTPNVSTSNAAVNLPSGSYTVLITDINDPLCFSEISFALGNSNGPAPEILSTTPATCLQPNGTAVLSPVTYQYEWCNGAVGFNVGNLPVGICFVTVTDFSTGCTNIIEVEIEAFNILEAEAVVDAMPDCGAANGEVTIDVTGGSTSYSYAWSDGGVSQTRDDLEAGVYTVTVTDNGATGCEVVVAFTLLNDIGADAIATVTLDSDSIFVSCTGDANAFMDFTLDLGSDFEAPATVEILNATGEPQINGNLSAGVYCIVVTDGNGCVAGAACFEVLSPDAIDVDVSIMNQDCDTLGVIELVVTGGTGAYTFDWADLPGSDDPQDRILLTAGGYFVTVTDESGCTAVADMLPIIDECSGCPSPDTVEMILPVFTTDSICFVLESCFDTSLLTTYSLTTGGNAGSSTFGTWTLSNEGCLFYNAGGTEGTGVDTICMVANNNGLLDTTCVIVTIVPSCNGLFALDSLELSTFECSEGGSFCLPIPLIEVLDFEFTDNGLPYSGGFMGCDLDTIQTYLLQPLLDVAPVGPYELESWTVNGVLFDIDTLTNIQQLVDSMNLWDPSGGWVLSTVNTIVGGNLSSVYGNLNINQLITMANANLPLSTTEIPNGTMMTVDTGFHQIIVVEIATGCADTLNVGVECQDCPTLYSGPSTIAAESCSELTDVCLDVAIENVFNYLITDNGDLYTEPFMGCAFDSLFTYLTVGFNTPGSYTLDSWSINGTVFDISSFGTLGELVDSMNVWDPAANWTINGLLLTGGDYNNVYGDINISENGVPSVMANPNLQLIPSGAAISLAPGEHEVILTDTITGCVDSFNVTITCQDCEPFYTGPDTLYNLDCPEPQGVCIDLSLNDLNNYLIFDNGLPYGASTIGCNFDSLTTYLTVGFNTPGGYTVENWDINGSTTNFLGFFVSIQELVDWMNIVDPGGNWSINGILIMGGDPGNIYGQMIITENGLDIATVDASLQLIPNGINLQLDEGSHELIVVDTVIGCTDTFSIQVECIANLLPDTLYLDILIGFTDTFCLDPILFPGAIDTIYNICEDESGQNVFVSVIDGTTCIEYTGITLGQDTACIVICDDLMNCDTTYFILTTIPPISDTILTTVVLSDTDTLCFDVSELAGTMYTITNYCDDNSGVFVDFEIGDSVCIEFTGLELGIDTACIEICDELGACDTTILIVSSILGAGDPPIAVDDDTTTVKGTGVDIDILSNDTINGDLSTVVIITDPKNGTAFVNPDFTVTYIPDVDFCGSIDSFEYVLTTSTGSDTAWVFVDVQCDELIIFSGFSPNGDGVNDHFSILGIENFPDNEVSVFNRWGNRVFLKKGYTNADGWQGTWSGKNLPDGTYFYVIDDGEGQRYSGYVQIQR